MNRIYFLLLNMARRKAGGGFGKAHQTNFNSIQKDGRYWIDPNITTTNAPVNAYGILEVIRQTDNDAGAIMQRFNRYNHSDTYFRMYENDQWYAWQRVSSDYVDNAVATIGTYKTASMEGTTSVNKSTWKNLISISLGAGVWVVEAQVACKTGDGAYRMFNIGKTSASSSNALATMEYPPVSGGNSIMGRTSVINLSTTTTIYLNVYHVNSAALDYTGAWLHAVRII